MNEQESKFSRRDFFKGACGIWSCGHNGWVDGGLFASSKREG